MGSLMSQITGAEITGTIDLFSQHGISRDDLKRLRGNTYLQKMVAKAIQGSTVEPVRPKDISLETLKGKSLDDVLRISRLLYQDDQCRGSTLDVNSVYNWGDFGSLAVVGLYEQQYKCPSLAEVRSIIQELGYEEVGYLARVVYAALVPPPGMGTGHHQVVATGKTYYRPGAFGGPRRHCVPSLSDHSPRSPTDHRDGGYSYTRLGQSIPRAVERVGAKGRL
jgi:hypothetical protein